MAVPLGEPTPYDQIWHNQFQTKDTRQQPHALRWWQPNCTYGTGCETCYTGCKDNEPPLVNGWAQPLNATNLEKFAFRLHADGSLEFKGHLNAAGAASGTVAVTLPGAVLGEDDFRPPNNQFFITVITTDSGVTFTTAMVKVFSATGNVTITWPAQ